VDVRELAPGLWRWTAPHPEWTPASGGPSGWPREVGSVYHEQDGVAAVIDPMVPADPAERDRFWHALDRDVAGLDRLTVLLTCPWHRRSAHEVVNRYGERGNVELVGHRSLAARVPGLSRVVADGDDVAPGVVAHDLATPGTTETVYRLTSHAAIVPGDVLIGTDAGLRVAPAGWYDESPAERGWYTRRLRPALADILAGGPLEAVLVSHGPPVLEGGTGALRRALELPAAG
jgi:hypothetical protein